MRFIKIAQVGKNKFMVITKKDDIFLGDITYYKRWRKWIFTPDVGTFYDSECMIEIGEYLRLYKLQG